MLQILHDKHAGPFAVLIIEDGAVLLSVAENAVDGEEVAAVELGSKVFLFGQVQEFPEERERKCHVENLAEEAFEFLDEDGFVMLVELVTDFTDQVLQGLDAAWRHPKTA